MRGEILPLIEETGSVEQEGSRLNVLLLQISAGT